MKKLVFVSLFCIVACLSSYSQTKQESIKELFHLMQQDSLMDKSFRAMIPAMFKQMQSQLKDSAALARAKELMTYTIESTKGIAKNMLNEDMVLLYDKYFNENEINDFIAFYKSPSGQKLIQVQPDIQKEMMTLMFQKYIPEIQKTMKARVEELKAAEKNKSQSQQ